MKQSITNFISKFKVNFIVVSLFSLFSTVAYSQVYIEQSGADLSELDVTEYDKELILNTTTEILTKYKDIADFLSPTGQFSEEKYADFLGLFSGGSKVFNDLVEKDGDNIEYAVYADNVYQYMQGTGVKFELNDVYLDKIKYDSGGFYIVTLTMEKLMLNGLNSNNVTTNYNNGIPIPLEMKIEMPDYDITQATILSILGEGVRKKVERSSKITLDGAYYLGTVFGKTNGNYSGFSEDVAYPIKYNAYGVESLYKISLNQSKTFWFMLGVQANFNNFTIDLGNYRGLAPVSDKITYQIGGKTYYETGSVQSKTSDQHRLLQIDNGATLTESLTAISIEIPIGFSYLMASTYDYDFSIDFAVVPGYILSGSGSFASNGLTYFDIPNDTLFTQAAEDYITQNELAPYYNVNDNFDKATTISNNFTVGAMIAPNFHYKFNYRMAFEVGANVQYNFLPFLATGHKDGTENQQLVNYLSNDESVYTSTLQQYFNSINLLRYGLKVGVVFKL